MTDAWEKLEALSNGMGSLERLLEADRWEEVGEELRGQEKLTKEFAMWLGHRLQGSVKAGEMARRCCEKLKGQMELVVELREATSRRKAELLEGQNVAIGRLAHDDVLPGDQPTGRVSALGPVGLPGQPSKLVFVEFTGDQLLADPLRREDRRQDARVGLLEGS